MALDPSESQRLSGIADSLRRSDPELARELAAPMRRASLWAVVGYLALAGFALVTLVGVAIGDTTAPSSVVHQNQAAHSRPLVHAQVDGQAAVNHASPMRSAADFIASLLP